MRVLIKIVAVVGALAALGFFFVRSVRSTQAEPYSVEPAHLRDWTVEIEPASNPTSPMLVLRARRELASALFRQVFARMAESLNAPAAPAIPLVLQGEFESAIEGRVAPEALLAAAREEGLESADLKPLCLARRRESAPGVTRQLYFVLFDSPEFNRFRERVGVLTNAAPALPVVFDPAALSPVLIVGASDAAFDRWLPLRAEAASDCVAPIVIGNQE